MLNTFKCSLRVDSSFLRICSAAYVVERRPKLPNPTRRMRRRRSSTSPTPFTSGTTTTSSLVQFHPT